jgi:hypothetical protein
MRNGVEELADVQPKSPLVAPSEGLGAAEGAMSTPLLAAGVNVMKKAALQKRLADVEESMLGHAFGKGGSVNDAALGIAYLKTAIETEWKRTILQTFSQKAQVVVQTGCVKTGLLLAAQPFFRAAIGEQ